MGNPAPADRRLKISRLEFRLRNLHSKRRALCSRLGETLVGARPDGSPTEETAEEYRSARGIRQAIEALQAEDVALAADSSEVSRGARFARSLVSVGERGATYARAMKVESRLKKLEEQRSALLAQLGRALAPHRDQVEDELVTRLIGRVTDLEAELGAAEAETRALAEATAAMDPGMRRRIYWIAGVIVALVLAFLWWIALGIVF